MVTRLIWHLISVFAVGDGILQASHVNMQYVCLMIIKKTLPSIQLSITTRI